MVKKVVNEMVIDTRWKIGNSGGKYHRADAYKPSFILNAC